jgi:hypothetical protein
MADTLRPAQQRLITLDALRGFALLGILVPNIVSFAWPMAAMVDPGIIGPGRWNQIGHDLIEPPVVADDALRRITSTGYIGEKRAQIIIIARRGEDRGLSYLARIEE